MSKQNYAKGTTFLELMGDDLARIITVEVVEGGSYLEVSEACDNYFVRLLTKAQARVWVAGLAAIVDGM